MSKYVDRWFAPKGFVAIENVGDWSSCDGCQALEEPYGECMFDSIEQALCFCDCRKDKKVVTLREANKHFFLHTGGTYTPTWVEKLSEEHPTWTLKLYWKHNTAHLTDVSITLAGHHRFCWTHVKYFQVIPTT